MPSVLAALYPSWPPPAPTPTTTVLTLESFALPSFPFPLTSESVTPTSSSALSSTLSLTRGISTSLPSPTVSTNTAEFSSATLVQLHTALYLLIGGCAALVIVVFLHGFLYFHWRRQRITESTLIASTLKGNDSTSGLSFASPGSLTPHASSDAEAVENGSLPLSAQAAHFHARTATSSFPSSLSLLAKPKRTRDRATQTPSKHHRRQAPTSTETHTLASTSTPPDSPTGPSHTSRDTVGRIIAVYSSYRESDPTSPNTTSSFDLNLHPDYTSTSKSSETDRDAGPTLTLQFPTPPSSGLSSFAPLDGRALSRAGRSSPFSDFGDDDDRDRKVRNARNAGSREGNGMLEQFLRSIVLDGEGGRESAIRTISHSSTGVEEGRWWFV